MRAARELLGAEVEEYLADLGSDHVEVPACLALFQLLTDAEDGPEAAGEGEGDLFIEGGGGLVVVLPAL